MKRSLIVLAVVTALMTGSLPSHAAPPQTMNYQGVLKSIAGAPITGAKKLTFKIYDAATGGNLLWTEIHPAVNVAKGQFSLRLGAGTPAAPLTLAFDKPYWLGITVDPETLEMAPRQPLTSEPYAFRASVAESVTDGAISTLKLGDGSVTAAKLAGNGCTSGQVMQYNGTAWVCAVPAAAFSGVVSGDLTVTGKVGIGTAPSVETLSIAGNGSAIELGVGVPGKEWSAGKIAYQKFGVKDSLDIVGAGPLNNRKIHFYSEGGATFDGKIIFPDGSAQTRAKTDCMGRYEDNGDGTVTDCRTGLIWLKNANCTGVAITWDAAVSWAASIAHGKCSLFDGSAAGDWRLPTKTEWMTMVASAKKQGFTSPGLTNGSGTSIWTEGDLFENIAPASYYWSSSTHAGNTIYAWVVNMYNGYMDPHVKEASGYVWPVRSGQ